MLLLGITAITIPAEAVGVIKEAAVQVFVLQPGIQSAAVLAQVGDGGGFVGKQVAQRQGVLLQVSDDVAHAVRQAGARQLRQSFLGVR